MILLRIDRFLYRHWMIITIGLLLIITVLSLYPIPVLPEMGGNDKIRHFIAYGVLTFPVSYVNFKKTFPLLLVFVCFSGCIELIQPLVNRNGEWLDLLANAAGIVIGFLVGKGILTLKKSFFLYKNSQ
ncbi:MAG: VanZ family protein [Flammeovirgaceae bacterium]|jgi:hypothetical protein|nr:VanZ family protein [Flammeovirgaceae bacterium]|tara:strand:- start:15496 stop:15879 length:384 start_codon:yes stop_codon:yes gene_type:complete